MTAVPSISSAVVLSCTVVFFFRLPLFISYEMVLAWHSFREFEVALVRVARGLWSKRDASRARTMPAAGAAAAAVHNSPADSTNGNGNDDSGVVVDGDAAAVHLLAVLLWKRLSTFGRLSLLRKRQPVVSVCGGCLVSVVVVVVVVGGGGGSGCGGVGRGIEVVPR
jgi:hypothetical protein